MGTGNQPRRNKDKLTLGQKVSDLELNITHNNMVIIMTNKDTEITADLVICCTGMKINTAAYSSNLRSVTMLLGMGHNDGVGQFKGLWFPHCLITQGKSNNLLLWKSWKEMGQKAPERAIQNILEQP
eukprot:XP_014056838.1 PREDICTED: apoptosis-inducing factor 2-like [Salmo salar]